MQYKVPQNVDIEDKVIAGLTLRQFMFLMIAGGFVLMLKYLLPPDLQFIFIPIAIIVGGMGIALAFIKINDRPLEFFLVAAAKTVITPPQRIWQKEINLEQKNEKKPVIKKDVVTKENINEIRGKLDTLALIVDSGGSENLIGKNRTTNIKSKEISEPTRMQDLLGASEKTSETLSNIMEKAKRKVTKNEMEQPISTMATRDPGQDRNYLKQETIELTNENQVKEMLSEIKREEQEKESKLQTAKIQKFSDKK